MPSDDKKTKTNAAPKADVAAKKEALTTNKTEGQSKDILEGQGRVGRRPCQG